MLERLAWLGLEVRSIDRARGFYEDVLDLEPAQVTATEIHYPVGDSELRLRRPTSVPRGGVHTHYALSIPSDEYDGWWDRLSVTHDLAEATFGDMRSMYCDDPDGHCVELGQQPVAGPGIDGIFEVALEVRSLERAVDRYTALGFAGDATGGEPDRVRLDGPIALEVWEPRLGIADARGGLHVDLGVVVSDLQAAVDAIDGDRLQERSDRVVVRDPDGHVFTFVAGDRSQYRNP